MNGLGTRKCIDTVLLRSQQSFNRRKQFLGVYYGAASNCMRSYASASANVVQRPTAKKANPPMSQTKPVLNTAKTPTSAPFKVSFAGDTTPARKAPAPAAPKPAAFSLRPKLTGKIKSNALNRRHEALAATEIKEAKQARAEQLEKQLEQLKELAAIERHNPTIDPWSGAVQTLDLHIPLSRSFKEGATLRDHVDEWKLTFQNYVRNVISMWRMAKANAFPDVDVKRRYSLNVLLPARIKPNDWLAPFRAMALKNYKQVLQALANLDERTMKRLTTGSYQDDMLKYIKQARDQKMHLKQHYVKDNQPPIVVSIRAIEGYLGAEEPKIGNRLLVQICVMFDMEQTIEVYNRDGKLLTREGAIALNQEPQPSRTVEFIVFEKKMWYDGPWVIRDQLYPGVKPKFTELQ
ncbi:hypothetical protein GLOTRDRAFT_140568 [Gloeophyllum trabeum ATCC 11539]|uniref:Tim44-like domain-containing protein n=1 Tax=Gloeophyllum trabeum (strain ATCC 11539 / FP-39264 / Madison 617) TaxID=670483 RepID=S7RHS0_GLOTA|nr:uncharacterized protein GLOTRDRAFT_140568 [Gloeophyllum trabeum ATCC 11539]EPQ52139.1 hypothetical protein GLOTRDRAFT_140568 [Gloeophyllum trabeum ATCC 11539]